MRSRRLASVLAAGLLCTGGATAAEQRAAPLAFEGRMLLSVSDADMLASAYVNGRLGPREGRDALSVVPLGGHARDLKAHEIEAGNSVAGPPVALAATPDGRHAFVIETWTARPEGPAPEQTFADLRHGERIVVVDLADPAKPRIVQDLALAERPDAVSVNAAGDLLAVTFHPAGAGRDRPLALIPFADGELGTPVYVEVPGLPQGNRLIHAEWHPKNDTLALVDSSDARVSFSRVSAEGEGYRLEAWGNGVQIGKAPFMARFTPDGRHLIVNNFYWGPDVQGTWTEAPRGDVVSIRLEAGQAADDTPRHALVSRAMTGVSPEGLAISPDGRFVVTTNLERSYLPYDDSRITWFSSLTLMTIEPQSGRLTRIGDFPYDGILPEAAAFDASSRYLAVVTYDHFDDALPGGSIDFWRIGYDPLDPKPLLVKTGHSVPVTRGAHSLVLVR